TAVVADIAFAIRSDCRAVGATGNFRDHFLAPVGPNPCQPPAADFDPHDRSVRHDHRPFRKFETGGENANIGHEILPAYLSCRRIPGSSRTRIDYVAGCYDKAISLAKQSPAMRSRREARARYSLTGIHISRPPLPVS